MIDRKLLGKGGEMLALQICYGQGYDILEQNYHCRFGEVDLICAREGVICFFEVKTRMENALMGRPCQSVNAEKQRRIRRCAEYYLMRKGLRDINVEFQVIEIVVNVIDHAF